MQVIRENIYYEDQYPGVTLGAIIQPRGTLMIDAPLRAEDARTWRSVLMSQSRGTHRLLINLDTHTDRALGTRAMECTTLAHSSAGEAFENRAAIFKGQNTESSAEWENYPEVIGSRWTRPHLTFSHQISLHWGDFEIRIEHQPGPMPCSVWVNIPEHQVIFVGDAVTPDQPPFLANADLETWLAGLDLLLSKEYKNYTIVSGRGGPTSPEAVREQRRLIKAIQQKVEKLAERNVEPYETEKLIPAIMKNIAHPTRLEDFYTQRLRYGLYQYYLRQYGPNEPEPEE
ncbi:MAG: hypothetical protein JW862_12655 [Anaerolineales bacterium]|nr:hypothetical protein [Anaerolineales bacterium]